MKVLVVHNFHRSGSASGDDQVFKHETAMLKNAGIELLRYTIHTDEFDNKNSRREQRKKCVYMDNIGLFLFADSLNVSICFGGPEHIKTCQQLSRFVLLVKFICVNRIP